MQRGSHSALTNNHNIYLKKYYFHNATENIGLANKATDQNEMHFNNFEIEKSKQAAEKIYKKFES